MKLRPIVVMTIAALTTSTAMAAKNVDVTNFARAETDTMIRNQLKMVGDAGVVGELFHLRQPTPLDQQPIIRMNMDTLYTGAILDLSKPATITIPDGGERYISMQVTNQDHYIYAITEPGTYTLTEEEVGSRYVSISFRIFADMSNPEDIRLANDLQDKIELSTPITGGKLDLPEWNQTQLTEMRVALNQLAVMGFDTSSAFGVKEDIKPVEHLIGTAAGWGGLPPQNAMYEINEVINNTGEPHVLTVQDVPVNAFWSITVYNSDGFMQENEFGRYSFNNYTAEKNSDGSTTIHFGECESDVINCIPITEGWNYVVRMYEPADELIKGNWAFPTPQQL